MEREKDWWKKSTVYQIYPRSFNDSNGDGIGDLPGIIEKLDYLKELGADVIWLSPVYDSPNDDNGYDIRDYYSIHPEFGTMEDFDRLLDEAHLRGLKIIMDLVVNHTSDEHRWFKEARKSKDSPYRDYYIWRAPSNGKEPNNWGSVFSGPAWEYTEETGEYYLHLFSKKQPDLNWENEKLREEIYSMMRFWLDKGVDGFRMDVINFISKVPGLPDGVKDEGSLYGDGSPYYMNGPRIHEFLQEMNRKALAPYNVLTVGEMPGAAPEEALVYTKPENHEVNMIFTFEHMDLDSGPGGKWDVRPLDLRALKQNLDKWQTSLNGIGWNSLYWNNHDQPRAVSRFGDDGEFRSKSAKMLGVCLHMMQGTPYVYQGEEIGMTNTAFPSISHYKDIEILNMFKEKKEQGFSEEELMKAIHIKGRDNARTPFQWNSSPHAGFTEGTPWIEVNPLYKEINAERDLASEDSIFAFYKQLIRLRKSMDIITDGGFRMLLEDDPSIFSYLREKDGEQLLVICSFSREEEEVPEELLSMADKGDLILSNYSEWTQGKLQPYEASVYLIK